MSTVLINKLGDLNLVLTRGLHMALDRNPHPITIEGPDAPACHHHWVIEPAHGSVSQGECQVCHEVREFKNSIEWQYGQRKPGRPASS